MAAYYLDPCYVACCNCSSPYTALVWEMNTICTMSNLGYCGKFEEKDLSHSGVIKRFDDIYFAVNNTNKILYSIL